MYLLYNVWILKSINNGNLYYSFDMEHPNKQVSRISVVQYFKRYRNYNIKYPKLPCLQVGNVSKNIALPIEVSIFVAYYIIRFSLL